MKKALDKIHSISIFKYAFSLLLFAAFVVRSYGRAWDNWTHMHPDERMLMMVTEKIDIPKNLYPDFFNYGTLPIYLLRAFAQFMGSMATYPSFMTSYGPGLLSLGRTLSSIFDLGTILGVYFVANQLTKRKGLSLAAACIYAFSFFSIQNSHFFVVDVYVTFFLTWSAYFMLRYLNTNKPFFTLIQAAILAMAIGSKFTAVIFVPGSILTILLFEVWQRFSHKKLNIIGAIDIVIIIFSWLLILSITFFISMPYAILPPSGILSKFGTTPNSVDMAFSVNAVNETIDEFRNFFAKDAYPTIRFLRDMREQTAMNSNPYVFPYTLQYAGTLPYLYYLKNIFVWGMGPFISFWILVGLFYLISKINFAKFKTFKLNKLTPQSFIFIFLLFYYFLFFFVIGRSAVKFMRYMLPLYPPLSILAAYGLIEIFKLTKISYKWQKFAKISLLFSITGFVLWTFAFINIYSYPNTRSKATDWILANIPSGSTLAVEHWDDRVPIKSGEIYKYEELPLYDRPDNEVKWSLVNEKLKNSDYIILASNRLYAPLQRLTDCKIHKESCYPIASEYYKRLLANQSGFKKIAEFADYPRIGPFVIPDDGADESFTVYDHPKIIIFKKL